MAEPVLMDFNDYQARLSINQKTVLSMVERGTLGNVQRAVREFWANGKDDELFNYILLLTALRRKHKSISRFLIKGCPIKISQKISHFSTPLYYAVCMHDFDIFKMLWKKGASVTEKGANGVTALELAMNCRNDIIINFVMNEIGLPKNLARDLKPDREEDIALFHAACWIGNWEAIEMFISRNFSPNSRSNFKNDDWKGFTSVHFALQMPFRYSEETAANKLLSHPYVDLFAADQRGRTPVNLAFRTNSYYLLENEIVIERITRADNNQLINPVDDLGLSHFHIVCALKFGYGKGTKHMNSVRYFIDNEVDLNLTISLKDERFPGYTALHLSVESSSWDILKLLLEHGADPNRCNKKGFTPLHMVCSRKEIKSEKRLELVKLLMQHGADSTAKDSDDRTALHHAFNSYPRVHELDESELLLLSKNQECINHTDAHGLSYLHMACAGIDLSIVRTLVANGAPINSCVQSSSCCGYSALHFAAELNRVDTVEFLLSRGADVKCVDRVFKCTPLHAACSSKFEQVPQSNAENKVTNDHIKWFPSREDHIKTIKLLIEHGAPVNAENHCGTTPLMHNFSIPNVLASQDGSRNQKLKEGISQEVFARQKEVMDVLLRHGADINACDRFRVSILHILTRNYEKYPFRKKLIEIALEKGANVNAVSTGSNITPLHVAVEESMKNKDDTSLIDLFLEHGADVNARSINLNTPLHVAAESSPFAAIHADVLAKLLGHPDIDINAQNKRGQTPLHVAMDRWNHFTIEKLLRSGSDINILDKDGHSPIHGLLKNIEGDVAFGIHRDGHEEGRKILTTVVAHMKVLLKLNLHDGQTVSEDFQALLHYCLSNKDHFASMDSEIDEELEQLKSQRLDVYTSYYDILFKDSNALAKHVLNEDLRVVITSIISKGHFPYFGGFIKRQYDRGCKRLSILGPAKSALNYVSNIDWPDDCSEKMLSFLSDENLKILIESVSTVKSRKRSADNTLRLEESSSKIPRLGE